MDKCQLRNDFATCGCSLLLWTVIIGTCAGFITNGVTKGKHELVEYNVPIIKFVEDNEHKVKILHINDILLPNGKFPPVNAIHCIMEGILTKERRFIIINLSSTTIPMTNEIWRIKVVYDFAGAAYQTKENPGRARIVLVKKFEGDN